MKTARILRHLRLLPAVVALGATLLAVKGFGVAFDARAEGASHAPAVTAPIQVEAGRDPAAVDSDSTSAEVDVLTSLGKRRAALDAREEQLRIREALIEAAEKRMDDKLASLKELQSQIQVLLSERSDAQQKEMIALTKTYSSMKPHDAARIFNNLNEDVLLGVALAMKPDVLGAVLAQMQPEAAQKLTVRLADRTKLPESSTPKVAVSAEPAPAAATQPVAAAAPQPEAAAAAAPAPADAQTKTADTNAPPPSSAAAPPPAK